MLESDKLMFLEGLRINCDLIDELLLVDRRLTYDDALHLASALQANCSRFVTTDRLFDEMEGSGELLDFMRRKNLNVKFINVS